MKNLTLINSEPPRLYESATGNPITFYNQFTDYLWSQIGLSYQPRTAIAMAKGGRVFTEFLFEIGIFSSQVSAEIASTTMERFGQYLVQADQAKDAIIRAIAIRTGRKPISRSSARQYVAAANLQLHVTSTITLETAELRSILFGEAMQPVSHLPALIPRTRSMQEMAQLHAHTLQVNADHSQASRTTAGGLRAPKADKSRKVKHIAVADILPMLDNAPTPLVGLICAMCGGGGLRLSETIGVKLEDIDLVNRTFSVHDPKGLRGAVERESTDLDRFGFKGRETSAVTMYEPFKSIFWKKLSAYLAVRPQSDSEFLLLSLDEKTYGTPLTDLKANSVNKAVNRQIQATQTRLGLSPHRKYSSHCFRHFYGIWGRNYVWVPTRAKPGLDIAEMQTFMGHASIQSTEIYAADLGLNGLIEIDAANELIYHKNEGESIDFYRGQIYARLANRMLGEEDEQ